MRTMHTGHAHDGVALISAHPLAPARRSVSAVAGGVYINLPASDVSHSYYEGTNAPVPANPAAPEPVSPPVRRVGGWLTRLASGVGHAVKTVAQVAAKTLCGAARWSVTGVLRAGRHGYRFVKTLLLGGWLRLKSVCRKARELGSPLVLSVWVGLVVGLFTFAAGPFLASLLSGLIGQLLVLKALVVRPLRRWMEVNPDGGAE